MGKYRRGTQSSLGMRTVCVRLLRRYWKEEWDILRLLEAMRFLVQLLKQGPVTISQIGKLFGNAFMKVASVQTVVSGFIKTGVHPLNPEILRDWMFEPAETTNRPIQGERNDDQLPEHRISPPRTPPRTPLIIPPKTPPITSPTSPLRKPPSITTIPTKQFYANSSSSYQP
ncbi:hypothetical protein JTB14_031574 [Gonioctena quinquepunctata]|nr:hypothetical protein JTB14_031574 [Gonioctena quinquepunctata]